MSEIQYNFAMLSAAAEQCGSTVSAMDMKIAGLKSDLAPLIAAWSGDAQSAYKQRQDQWDEAAGNLRDMLGKIQKALVTSAQRMEQQERANQKRLQGY